MTPEDGEGPIPPESLPKYLHEGVQKQDVETIEDLIDYCVSVIDWKEAQAEAELSGEDVAGPADRSSPPDDWEASEEEWSERLDDAYENAEIEAGKGSVHINTINGNDYYYLKWREGDKVLSQYISPVNPS